MRSVASISSILTGVRRYSDSEGRFACIDSVDYQSGVVVYSVATEDSLGVHHGYRTTIQEVLEKWKMLGLGEKHALQVKRDKEREGYAQ